MLAKQTKVRIQYNDPGHSREFTIHLPGYDLDNYIPAFVERRMADKLGTDYDVCNRGTRIEVISSLFTGDGDEHLPVIREAVTHAVQGMYPQLPEVDVVLHPYTPPPRPKRECQDCGQSFELRELLKHRKDEHPQG